MPLKMQMTKKILLRGIAFFFSVFLIFLLLDFIFPFNTSRPFSQVITAKDGTVIHAFMSDDEKWRMPVKLNEVSESLLKGILFKEDKYFYYHPGINPMALMRAGWNNIIHGRRTSGASTITMQVARILSPAERTYFNKLKEMFRAMQLEWHYSKEEILEMYLNNLPYGGNIEGVKAASVLYFGRLPGKLTLAESVTLCVIPNRPVSLKPGNNNQFVFQARNKWLNYMQKAQLFSSADIEDALKEPLETSRQNAPQEIPQLANRLRKLYKNQIVVSSTLSPSVQHKAQSIVYNYSKRLKSFDVNNAAAIIINNQTHEVEGYVASADFSDRKNNGEVDGITGLRSPGSTLKPLVYALAFDQGMITPKYVMADVPINFDGYAPENFNSKYNGLVTIEKALAYSLNIPAVKTLRMISLPLMIDHLKACNFSDAKKRDKKLGLSMILGGCGASLEELCGLYSSFANDGKYFPLKYVTTDSSAKGNTIISEGAAFVLSEILSSVSRPDLPNNFESSLRIPKVAWKTGTSYGRRDAWSIGYNSHYTIGVWTGNFDGKGVPELTGAEMATPLLFELFNAIDYSSNNKWFAQPASLDFRLVCSESGLIPDEHCENQVIDFFLPAISSIEKCKHQKEVAVSADEKISYCTSCQPLAGYKRKWYKNLSNEMIGFYQQEKINFESIPPHNPACSRVFDERPPQITSLVNKKEYLLEKNTDAELALGCNVAADVSTVYWYVNDRFYKSCKAGEEIFFMPDAGKLKISCSDDKGRNTNINISVAFY